MSEPIPASTLSTIVELTPVVDKLGIAAGALMRCPIGQPMPLPPIRGVKIAHADWDVAITLTRR